MSKVVSDYFFVGRRRLLAIDERDQDERAAEQEGQTPIIQLPEAKFRHRAYSGGTYVSILLLGDLCVHTFLGGPMCPYFCWGTYVSILLFGVT